MSALDLLACAERKLVEQQDSGACARVGCLSGWRWAPGQACLSTVCFRSLPAHPTPPPSPPLPPADASVSPLPIHQMLLSGRRLSGAASGGSGAGTPTSRGARMAAYLGSKLGRVAKLLGGA